MVNKTLHGANLEDYPKEMRDRITRTLPGQVTFCVLGSRNSCKDCEAFELTKSDYKVPFKGRCGKVYQQTKKPGVQYNGKAAIACSLFRKGATL